VRKAFFRSGRGIVHEIKQELSQGHFPLIVTDGTADGKRQKILATPYLQHCYSSLLSEERALLVVGFGFKQNDRHILEAIAQSKVSRLIVGAHGGFGTDPELAAGVQWIIRERSQLRRSRSGSDLPLIKVAAYDSSKFRPWGTGPRTTDQAMEIVASGMAAARERGLRLTVDSPRGELE
jgi:hypothetical protein